MLLSRVISMHLVVLHLVLVNFSSPYTQLTSSAAALQMSEEVKNVLRKIVKLRVMQSDCKLHRLMI